MTTSRDPNHGYYTDVETSQRLEKSLQAVWKMGNLGQLPSKRIDGKRMYPKNLIDEIAAAKQAPLKRQTKALTVGNTNLAEPKTRNDTGRAVEKQYFSLEQVAYAFNREQKHINKMVRTGEVRVEKIDGRSWVSVEEMERLISKREPFRQSRVRKRLSKPQWIFTQRTNKLAVDLSQSRRSTESTLDVPDPNANNPGTSVNNLNPPPVPQKVDVASTRRIPTARYDSQASNALDHGEVQEFKDQIRDLEKALNLMTEQLDRSREAVQRERKCSEQTLQEADQLREWTQTLQGQLLEEREKYAHLKQELERGRKEKRYSPEKTRYEMDQLSAELENTHRYVKHLRSRVGEEQELRQHNENRVTDLQAALDRNEVRKSEIEEALFTTKAELLRLQEEKILLDKVRELLGGVDTLEHIKKGSTPASDALQEKPDVVAEELVFQTQHETWTFRPPFELEEDEVELIRLVVGEYEITTEQIRRRKGRRAVEKLNDLLDRLLEAGVEPIKENNDCYTFDPDVLLG